MYLPTEGRCEVGLDVHVLLYNIGAFYHIAKFVDVVALGTDSGVEPDAWELRYSCLASSSAVL